MAQHAAHKNRTLIAAIGDEDTVTGLLLAGIGDVNAQQQANFLVVEAKTTQEQIEDTFLAFTKRPDVAIVLINQHIAESIRGILDEYDAAFPTVLEIPSKDHPYDPEKDSVLKRVQLLFGD
ncbi:H(+)-transporting V1 sector ATPase subunit F [Coemansia nantahalensis]|uniref:H(+)-transporting V1 sector ATPase subunit F n=2 Tax=Coemansia TaxID=4863 RepID=A0ACC1L5N1_9FUNG|nr:H(+)-transporting V1 sector ATPase subunit F [Coemansia nantahalensis]KAJ2770570.1 H(+)-transporting V1 sector ATPase subunit F [Coemansia nantahalensis]KAJ2801545.1 H(+)-transporting V1 sector ATPase subunit F [Coemansia helicoidea]